MNKGQTFTATLLLVVSATVLAGGHHGAGDGMFMGGGEGMGVPPRLAEKLNLSEQQQQDLLALMALYGPRFKQIAERGKADRELLAALAPDDSAYGEYSARVSQEAGLAAAESVTLLTELQSNIYALLNEEQQANYMDMRAGLRERMQTWREGSREGGMRPHHKHEHDKYEHGNCPHHAEKHAGDENNAEGESNGN
jgi:hypothetical protein